MLGHPLVCHAKPLQCKSKFLKLLTVKAHFPQIRSLVNIIYSMLRWNKKINEIQDALINTDVEKLQSIYDNSEISKNQANDFVVEDIDLNEENIKKRYKYAYEIFIAESNNLPRIFCISCERLFRKTDINDLKKYIGKIENEIRENLMKVYERDVVNGDHICNYCITKLRKGIIPPLCILNNLFVKKIPDELANLNTYETILIQRAKAYQVIKKKIQ